MLSKIIVVAVIAYACLIAYLFFFQRKLLYFPEQTIGLPSEYGLSGFDDLDIQSRDGTALQLWYKPAQAGYPTVAYFHGNAANIANRANIFHHFSEAGFGVAALSYRGYGKSAGSPTEEGLYNDARAAIDFLINDKNIPLSNVVIFGESLGTGVSVQMASEFKVGALMLQAAYTSVAQRASEIYFYVPVKLMLQDKFDSLGKITQVKSPLLLFHGELDTVIPIQQGRKLYDTANEPKEAHFFDDVDHTEFDYTIVTAHMVEFCKKHGLIQP